MRTYSASFLSPLRYCNKPWAPHWNRALRDPTELPKGGWEAFFIALALTARLQDNKDSWVWALPVLRFSASECVVWVCHWPCRTWCNRCWGLSLCCWCAPPTQGKLQMSKIKVTVFEGRGGDVRRLQSCWIIYDTRWYLKHWSRCWI